MFSSTWFWGCLLCLFCFVSVSVCRYMFESRTASAGSTPWDANPKKANGGQGRTNGAKETGGGGQSTKNGGYGRYLGQRDVEGEVEGQNDARQQDDEDGEGGVLKIRQLDLHRPVFVGF